eukprot:CAMPEP_0176182494 /NCGR_PEP_ID=MMETSP0120_2-20121206/93505_1 /TAXON_ID=160619 /ORGANISM="Kryptoperidinium foliaceum, Strain CCMP 1326" /LENGTH=107 /DNA_ID=CAMNT_0017520743 /DNA_START=96 /DNA_END=416 /DNA_ORIENTATION=+
MTSAFSALNNIPGAPVYDPVAATDEENQWDTLEISASEGLFEIGDEDDENDVGIFRIDEGMNSPQDVRMTGVHSQIPPPNYFCPLTAMPFSPGYDFILCAQYRENLW